MKGSFGFDGNFRDMFNGIAEGVRDFTEKLRETAPDIEDFVRDKASHGQEAFCHSASAEGGYTPWSGRGPWDWGNVFGYPPVTIYKNADKALVLEFGLAGIPEENVKIAFQGDYLVLSAKPEAMDSGAKEYYRRGFRPKEIDRQKYRVPADDYDQEKAKAIFKNNVLTVIVPAKDFPDDGIRVEIVRG